MDETPLPTGTTFTPGQVTNMPPAAFVQPGEMLANGEVQTQAGMEAARGIEPAATETKVYTDGTSATGPGPLPEQSPAQQDQAAVDALYQRATDDMLAKQTEQDAIDRAANEAAKPALKAMTEPTIPPILTGSSLQPSQFVYENGTWKATYSLDEVVLRACAESGMSATQWNSLGQDEREALIGAQVARIKAIVEGTAVQRPDGLHNTIKEVEVAKALTEIDQVDAIEAVHHEGAIQNFMDDVMSVTGAAERRVMRIVADAEGRLRKLHVPGFGT